MNPLQRALIEKAGNDHGFEYVLPSNEEDVHLASALHRVQGRIVSEESGFDLMFPLAGSHLLPIELARTLLAAAMPGVGFVAAALGVLGIILRRTAEFDAWYARAYGPAATSCATLANTASGAGSWRCGISCRHPTWQSDRRLHHVDSFTNQKLQGVARYGSNTSGTPDRDFRHQ